MAYECGVCNISYSEIRKPLFLSCGHTFCTECLLQLESKKICPTCRSPWNVPEVSRLPICYQLIPKQQLLEGEVEYPSCLEHSPSPLRFWCKSCTISACLKCVLDRHKKCDWFPTDEKVSLLFDKYKKIMAGIKKKMVKIEMVEKYCCLVDNDKNNEVNSTIIREMKLSHQQLKSVVFGNFEGSTDTAHEKVNSALALQRTCDSYKPAGLLAHIIMAYIMTTTEDADDFITNFRSIALMSVESEKNSDVINPVSAAHLEEGKTWVIKNNSTAIAVLRTLKDTRKRPSNILVQQITPETAMIEFLKDVSLHRVWIDFMPSDVIRNPSSVSKDTHEARLIFFVRNIGSYCSYWGHVTAAVINKMRQTLTNVALLIRSGSDMAAVLAVHNRRDLSLKEAHLIVMKTCALHNWTVETSAPIARRPWHVLHFPLLESLEDFQWAESFLNKLISYFLFPQNVKKLYFNGVSGFTADGILGRLRSWPIMPEVHLPESLAEDRNAKLFMSQKYREHGMSVVFDL